MVKRQRLDSYNFAKFGRRRIYTIDFVPVGLSTTKGHLRPVSLTVRREGFGLTSKNASGDIKVPDLMKTQLPILACPSDDTVKELNVNHFQWPGLRRGQDKLYRCAGRHLAGRRAAPWK